MAEAYTYSVSEVNSLVRDMIESSGMFNNVQVRGEVSNFKRYPSGHCYFTLKDKNSVLKCVMFKWQAQKLWQFPENGDTVLAIGRIGVYERDGVYQLYTDVLVEEGEGQLMQAYEKLRKKLEQEGLFDQERKKPLPEHPVTIGIVTSSAGAAVRDIIKVSRSRNPGIRLLLYPVKVQGKEAAGEISRAVAFLNRHRLADVLIVGRGGGSMEDLWAFNEEPVVRAIAASEIPVISSVGHESDTTLSDFAADCRAATPSQAAELAVPDTSAVWERVADLRERNRRAAFRILRELEQRYGRSAGAAVLRYPERMLDPKSQRVDHALEALRQTMESRLQRLEHRLELATASELWRCPERMLEAGLRRREKAAARLRQQMRERLVREENRLALKAARLDAVSPLAVLGRGYSLTTDEKDRAVTSVEQLHWGSEMVTRLKDGRVHSIVQEIVREEERN